MQPLNVSNDSKTQNAKRRKTLMMRRFAQKSADEEEEEDPKQQIRTRYLLEVKAAYMEHYEEGLLNPDAF